MPKKKHIDPEESVVLELEGLITMDLDDGVTSEETVSEKSLAAWIAEDPEMAAYYAKRKYKEQSEKDKAQDNIIRSLIRRVAGLKLQHEEEKKALESRTIELEKWVRYGQGAVAAIAVIWAVLTFVLPKIWTKEATKAVFCATVNQCVDKRLERYRKSDKIRKTTGRAIVRQAPIPLQSAPPPTKENNPTPAHYDPPLSGRYIALPAPHRPARSRRRPANR